MENPLDTPVIITIGSLVVVEIVDGVARMHEHHMSQRTRRCPL